MTAGHHYTDLIITNNIDQYCLLYHNENVTRDKHNSAVERDTTLSIICCNDILFAR